MSARQQNADAVRQLFAPPSDTADIHRSHDRHWLITLSGNLLATAVQFITTIILARLLTPSDFGVMAMVMGVIGVGHVLRNMGLTVATVRYPDITPEQVSVLFWINLALGFGLTLLAILAAPWIGSLYGDERLPLVALVLAVNFVLGAFPGHHRALLNRNMRFAELARIHVLSTLASASLTLMLAYHGFGYWAIVAASVLQAGTTAVLSWSLCPWRPGWPRRGTGARSLIKFGGYVLAFGVLSFAAKNVHNMALGRVEGASAVGLFNRALQLTVLLTGMITGALGTVAIATLSRLAHEPEEYRQHFRAIASRIAVLSAPLAVLMFVEAELIIPVLFGPQWSASVELLRILSLSIAIKTFFPTAGWLHLSRGDARGLMRWGALGWTVHIAFALVGVQYGLQGVAYAIVCSHCVLFVPTLRAAMADTAVSFGDLWQVGRTPLLTAILAAPILYPWAALGLPDPALLILASGAYASLYLLLLAALSAHYRQLFGDWLAGLRRRLSRRLPGRS